MVALAGPPLPRNSAGRGAAAPPGAMGVQPDSLHRSQTGYSWGSTPRSFQTKLTTLLTALDEQIKFKHGAGSSYQSHASKSVAANPSAAAGGAGAAHLHHGSEHDPGAPATRGPAYSFGAPKGTTTCGSTGAGGSSTQVSFFLSDAHRVAERVKFSEGQGKGGYTFSVAAQEARNNGHYRSTRYDISPGPCRYTLPPPATSSKIRAAPAVSINSVCGQTQMDKGYGPGTSKGILNACAVEAMKEKWRRRLRAFELRNARQPIATENYSGSSKTGKRAAAFSFPRARRSYLSEQAQALRRAPNVSEAIQSIRGMGAAVRCAGSSLGFGCGTRDQAAKLSSCAVSSSRGRREAGHTRHSGLCFIGSGPPQLCHPVLPVRTEVLKYS